MPIQPALFVSHGSPNIAIEPGPARDFLAGLGGALDRPDAILVVSAHHDLAATTVSAGARPPTIHDFRGFAPALYELRYPAPGDPRLAREVAELLGAAGFEAALDAGRGLDHGAWMPLMLAFPDADIPVVQLSINSDHPPDWHHALGRALAALRRRNVLIIGSGSLTHNLGVYARLRLPVDAPPLDWAVDFAAWIKDRLDAGDEASVLDAVERAPTGRMNHPTPDHLLPLFVAMGAGGEGARAERLHHSFTYGVLAMDAYRFA